MWLFYFSRKREVDSKGLNTDLELMGRFELLLGRGERGVQRGEVFGGIGCSLEEPVAGF